MNSLILIYPDQGSGFKPILSGNSCRGNTPAGIAPSLLRRAKKSTALHICNMI
jgi:hypothetical protein